MENGLNFNVFRKCINIQDLQLISNGDIDINDIVNLPKIQKLTICDTKIINSENIEKLDKLIYLKLDGSTMNNIDFLENLKNKVKIQYKKEYHVGI